MLVFVSNLHTEWHTISIWITWQKIPNNVIPQKDELINHINKYTDNQKIGFYVVIEVKEKNWKSLIYWVF
jgi:hypothetical protein